MLFGKSACSHKLDLVLMSKSESLECSHRCQPSTSFFGLKLCERILKITDNLSRTLQKTSLSAADAQHIASLTVTTLHKMRTNVAFQAFFDLVELLRTSAGVEQPSLPRKRKVPRRIDDGNGGAYFSETLSPAVL